MEGYLFVKMPVWERIIALACGLLLIIPGIATDIVGVALFVLLFVLQLLSKKKISPPV